MERSESVLSRNYTIATTEQVESVQKLDTIGWKWNVERVKRGNILLYNHVENDLPGRHKLGATVLIAEIDPKGLVRMGPMCDGMNYGRRR